MFYIFCPVLRFLGYISAGKNQYHRVFAAYLKPQLPPKVSLIAPTETIQNGLPTLKVNQLEGRQIRQLMFAFNGADYNVVNTQLLPKVYE